MLIIGIDPGISGAIVGLHTLNGNFQYLLMPTMEVGKANRVNGAAVASFIKGIVAAVGNMQTKVFLEKTGAMPGQGVTSMYSFGHSNGVVDGVVSALELPITLVTPQAWKKHSGLIGTEKDASRSRCVQMYPSCEDLHKKGKGQAIADALLIACYGAAIMSKEI